MQRLTLILSLLFFLTACQQTTEITKKDFPILPQVEIQTIESNLQNKFSVDGEVTTMQSANLTSEVRGIIQSIQTKTGKKVQKNQILLTLSAENIQSAYTTAQQALLDAQQKVTQTTQNNSKNIDIARINLETAQINLENILNENTQKKLQAQENLNSTRLNLNLTTNSAQNTLDNALNLADTVLQTNINALDNLLGISDFYKNKNDTYENNFGALNSITKTEAQEALRKLMQIYTKTMDFQFSLELLQKAEDATQKTLDMLENSTTSTTLTQTNLDNYINSIQTQLTTIQTTITNITSAQKAYEQTLNLAITDSVAKSQIILNAEAQYATILTQLNTAEEKTRQQLKSAQISYQTALTQSSLTKTNALTSLTQAQGNLKQAQINQEKLTIKAPFEGKIVNIPVKKGAEVNPGELLIQIENNQNYKIIVYLTPTQVQKIKIGDTVQIAQKSYAQISTISPSLDSATHKHKVEIMHQNPFLHSGQIVPVYFKVKPDVKLKTETIYIPLIALHLSGNESFVWTLNSENKTQKTQIKTGKIREDQIEIISGLRVGDKLIIKGGRLFEKEGISVSIKD